MTFSARAWTGIANGHRLRCHLRDACGMESPKALNVPFYIFDKNNIADAGVPASAMLFLSKM